MVVFRLLKKTHHSDWMISSFLESSSGAFMALSYNKDIFSSFILRHEVLFANKRISLCRRSSMRTTPSSWPTAPLRWRRARPADAPGSRSSGRHHQVGAAALYSSKSRVSLGLVNATFIGSIRQSPNRDFGDINSMVWILWKMFASDDQVSKCLGSSDLIMFYNITSKAGQTSQLQLQH